jgi:hypothetical protein
LVVLSKRKKYLHVQTTDIAAKAKHVEEKLVVTKRIAITRKSKKSYQDYWIEKQNKLKRMNGSMIFFSLTNISLCCMSAIIYSMVS